MFELNNLLEIIFFFDYWLCLLFGYSLNILLFVLIIYKTPKEMKTHSRILLQNCILDILLLTVHLLAQVFYINNTNGNITFIYTKGVLVSVMKENFNPFFFYNLFIIWLFIYDLNLLGLCVQFIYRYLILNRNINILFHQYLYMFSIVVIFNSFYTLFRYFFTFEYSNGGVNQVFENINKTWLFVECKMETLTTLTILIMSIFELIQYFIIIVCALKIIRYVDLKTNFNANMKIMVKQLTKTLIILAVIPFINQAEVLILIFSIFSKIIL
ncbi:hypothetical protein ACQ4LE_006863 [Meloidogyne hapla]